MRIAIYGAGGQGRESAWVARRLGLDPVMVSDDPSQHGSLIGFPVMALEDVPTDCPIVVAIADPRVRRKVAEKVERRGYRVTSLVAPTSVSVGPTLIGEGAILGDFTVMSDAVIGRHFHANVHSYVGHDCVIGDYVTLAPRVSINGYVHIADDVYIGTGAIIRNGSPDTAIRIGRGAFIAMGALVTKDVPAGKIVYPRGQASISPQRFHVPGEPPVTQVVPL